MIKAQAILKLGKSWILFWVRNGSFALLDQFLFSGSNFLLSVLLARWLEPEEYGRFVFAYSLFLLVSAFIAAIVIEPMTVFGSGQYTDRFSGYFRQVLLFYSVVITVIILLVVLARIAFGRVILSAEVSETVLWMTLSCWPMLLLQVVRGAFYTRIRPQLAALTSGIYAGLFFFAVYALKGMNTLYSRTVFAAIAISAFIASITTVRRVLAPPRSQVENQISLFSTREVASEHWKYGRWALATQAVVWLSGNFYYVVLPVWIGMHGVAILRALLNVVSPAIQVIAAFTALYIPVFSRSLDNSFSELARTVKVLICASLLFSLGYFLTLGVFPKGVLGVLYGSRYADFDYLIPVVALLPIMSGIISVLGSAMRAMNRPDKVFQSYLLSGVAGIAFGVPMSIVVGFQGALWGMVVSYMVTTALMLFQYQQGEKLLRR